MKLLAFAKINLTLDVTGRREDGYHTLEMIMQSVGLYDTVELEKNSGGIYLDITGSSLPCDERNIAYAAANLFYEKAKTAPEIDIRLEKRIPEAAGLGGGSADAAAVLFGLNKLYGEPFDTEALHAMALSLGADVPFCLSGGTMLAEGIGERLTAVQNMPDCGILLVKPGAKPSTGEMYRALDNAENPPHPDNGGMLSALKLGDLNEICRCLGNSFDMVWDNAECSAAKKLVMDTGALGVSLSGSGPTLFGIYNSLSDAQAAEKTLKSRFTSIFAVRPESCGIKIL